MSRDRSDIRLRNSHCLFTNSFDRSIPISKVKGSFLYRYWWDVPIYGWVALVLWRQRKCKNMSNMTCSFSFSYIFLTQKQTIPARRQGSPPSQGTRQQVVHNALLRSKQFLMMYAPCLWGTGGCNIRKVYFRVNITKSHAPCLTLLFLTPALDTPLAP